MFKTAPNLLAVLVACVLSLASASAATVFNVTGTLTDGSSLGGTLTIDTVGGTVTAANISLGAPDSVPCTVINFQNNAPPFGYLVDLTCQGSLELRLVLQSDAAGDLVGYAGGPIYTGVPATPDQSFFCQVPHDCAINQPDRVTGRLTPVVLTFQVGYAANLNIGDSVVNISNDGVNGGVYGATPATLGNICVNTYVFDPQEEEIGCCACLVTPNGLNSLSVKSDLISNNLTPAVPTSVVISMVGSTPALDGTAAYTVCNPATVATTGPGVTPGLLAWGSTLEPSSTPGTYNPVPVRFLTGTLTATELTGLTSLCNFIQSNGTGYGICKACRVGALSGAKQ